MAVVTAMLRLGNSNNGHYHSVKDEEAGYFPALKWTRRLKPSPNAGFCLGVARQNRRYKSCEMDNITELTHSWIRRFP